MLQHFPKTAEGNIDTVSMDTHIQRVIRTSHHMIQTPVQYHNLPFRIRCYDLLLHSNSLLHLQCPGQLIVTRMLPNVDPEVSHAYKTLTHNWQIWHMGLSLNSDKPET
jgi:hypothetical protein